MPKRINLSWLFLIAGLAALADLCLPHPTAYLCDPATIAISLAISAAVTGASAGVDYLIAKKQKTQPVDRGKQDDIRISTSGYGEAIIKGWGKFRCAPIWVWHTPIVHTTLTTPGQSGGKGTPKPPTPDTVDHIYTTSLAGIFHDGLIYGGVKKIWFDTDLVFNGDFAAASVSSVDTLKYEAELGTLAGGASVATQAECSSGRKVTGLGSGGTDTITVSVPSTDSYVMAVHYTSTADRTFKVSINGGGTTDLVCTASGGAGIIAIQTMTVSLTSGNNTIAFSNAGAACPDLDFISLAPALSFTGGADRRSFTSLINPNKIAPVDQNEAWAFSDERPTFSDAATGGVTNGGFYSATLSKWGQPSIRIYPGSETQTADSAIIADKGSANAPAYRGFAYIVIEGLQLQSGRIPNVTIEVDQGVREARTIVSDLYSLVGVGSASLDLSALNGLVLGDNSGFSAGTYSSITWANLVNATQTGSGAITKTSGAANTWNARADNGSSVSSGTDAALRFTASVGTFMIGFSTTATPGSALPHPYDQVLFGVILNLNSNPSQEVKNSIQMSLGGSNNSYDVGTWAPGDVFQVEIRNNRFAAYQNGIELGGFTIPVPSFSLTPVWMGYATGGGPSAASYATGSNIGSEPSVPNGGGLVITSRKSAADVIQDLQTRFQFDLPEVDGVVKAVMRNGSSDLTIPYSELRAHNDGEETPQYDALITDIDPLLLPAGVDVNYLDPARDYHNNTQSDMRLTGSQYDHQTVSLSLVESADNMKKLASTLLYRPDMEGRSFKFTTGPKYQRVHPGSVVTLTLPNATHVGRITEARYGLPAGVCEFEAVRHQASIYSPNGVGSVGSGYEAPIAAVSGNTQGVIIDGPLLRAEDGGDGTQPVVYVAMCGRGSGSWPGGFLYQEYPIASGNYKFVTAADKPSGIGVTTGTLASVSDPSVWDRTNSLTINFYSNTELSSATESDLLANPELNLLAIVNPSTNAVEYIQFKTASAGVASAPYITQYTISVFLRGRVGTDNNVGGHSSADSVVLIDSTVKPRRMDLVDIGRSLKFRFVTSGQSVDDAATVTQTLNGISILPLPPANLRGFRDSEGDLLIRWDRRSRLGAGLRPSTDVPLAEEKERYRVEIYSGSTLKRTMDVQTGMQMAAVLISELKNQFDGITHNTFSYDLPIITARTIQEVPGPDNFIEGNLEADITGGVFTAIGLQSAGQVWRGISQALWTDFGVGGFGATLDAAATTPYMVILETYGPSLGPFYQRFYVYEYGTRIFVASSEPAAGDYDEGFGWASPYSAAAFFRVRFNFVGSSVRIQKAHTANVPLTTIVTGKREMVYPCFALASVSGGPVNKVSSVTLTTSPLPATIYSESQQTEDFGSTQSSIKVRVKQFSSVVGYGPYQEATI